MRRIAANDNHIRRLLTKSQAAAYCGLSVQTFGSLCPVRAIALGSGARLERYDIQAIDGWIDNLTGNEKLVLTAAQLLEAL